MWESIYKYERESRAAAQLFIWEGTGVGIVGGLQLPFGRELITNLQGRLYWKLDPVHPTQIPLPQSLTISATLKPDKIYDSLKIQCLKLTLCKYKDLLFGLMQYKGKSMWLHRKWQKIEFKGHSILTQKIWSLHIESSLKFHRNAYYQRLSIEFKMFAWKQAYFIPCERFVADSLSIFSSAIDFR